MQIAFDFLEAPPARPRRSERLFFALMPPVGIAAAIGRLRDGVISQHRLRGTRVENERLHVSLHHVGDYVRLREMFVYPAIRAGNTVSMRAFDVTFGCIHSFDPPPSRRGRATRWPLVLLAEGDGLRELHQFLGGAMQRQDLGAGQHFSPHMTLLYSTKPVPTQQITPFGFTAREFVLIHSERSLTRYNVIGRWPLRA